MSTAAGASTIRQCASSRACPPRLEDIFADKRACKQILLNLISNALKFTPEGGKVTVTVSADGPFVEIAVSDTGIGVTQKDLSRLGDPFFQVKSTYDRPYEGAGLGLNDLSRLQRRWARRMAEAAGEIDNLQKLDPDSSTVPGLQKQLADKRREAAPKPPPPPKAADTKRAAQRPP